MKKKQLIRIYPLTAAIFCQTISAAQIPVVNEPHHDLIFENQYLRLFDLQIKAGDTTQVHSHSAATVVIFLRKSAFAIQNQGEPPVTTEVQPGNTIYRNYDDKPVIHRVWTIGSSLLRCFVIEIKKMTYGPRDCAIKSTPGIDSLWEQKSVRAYQVEISQGKRLNIAGSDCPYLLVSVSGGVTAVTSNRKELLKKGEFVFISPKESWELIGASEGTEKCILLELR